MAILVAAFFFFFLFLQEVGGFWLENCDPSRSPQVSATLILRFWSSGTSLLD